MKEENNPARKPDNGIPDGPDNAIGSNPATTPAGEGIDLKRDAPGKSIPYEPVVFGVFREPVVNFVSGEWANAMFGASPTIHGIDADDDSPLIMNASANFLLNAFLFVPGSVNMILGRLVDENDENLTGQSFTYASDFNGFLQFNWYGNIEKGHGLNLQLQWAGPDARIPLNGYVLLLGSRDSLV